MPNSIVQWYRQSVPDSNLSDEDIILEYGSRYPLAQLPQDFQQDYQRVKQASDVEQSSAGSELGKGFSRGMLGLKSSAAGGMALLSDTLGLEGPKKYFLDAYKNSIQQSAQESAPSVPKIETALQSPSAAVQYLAGKTGELVPALGEAGVFAAAGTLAAPGPGTEAGAAGGLFTRAALRTVLRKTIEKGLTPEIAKELEGYAAGTIEGKALSEGASKLVTEASKYVGGTAASMANFAAQGAGATYGQVSDTPDAKKAALIAGVGSSIGALIPAQVLKGLFPSIGAETARDVVDKWAVQVPKELLIAGSGMGAMEFFNIAAEKYAKKEDTWTKDDYSRILNAVAVGGLAGVPAAGLAALRPVKSEPGPTPEAASPEAPAPAKAQEPSEPKPPAAVSPSEVADTYGQITSDQARVLDEIANREVKNAATDADRTYIDTLPAGQQARYETIKSKVEEQNATETRQEELQQQREGDNGQLQKEAQDRNVQADQPEEGAQTSAGHQLLEAARGLTPEVKQALKVQGIDPEALTIGLRDVPEDVPTETPVDIAKSKAKAMLTAESTKPSTQKTAPGSEVKPTGATAPPVTQDEASEFLSQRTGFEMFEEGKPPPSESIAFRLKDGTIVSDKDARAHYQLVDKYHVDPDSIESRGFIDSKGKYRSDTQAPLSQETILPTSTLKEIAQGGLLSKVPDSYTAWRTLPSGKEIDLLYRDRGQDPSNKNRTKALGVFEAPDGKIVVASVYDNRGKKVFLGGDSGVSIESALKQGYKPIETIRTKEHQDKFFREYSKEEWAPVRGNLEAKASEARKIIPPVSEEAAGTSTTATGEVSPEGITVAEKPEQRIASEEPKGGLTVEDANRIHDLVIKETGGIPDADTAKENVADAILVDQGLLNRFREIGRDQSSELISNVLSAYEETAKEFSESGRSDPAEFRSAITAKLAGLTAKASEAGRQAGADVSPDIRYSRPSEVVGVDEDMAFAWRLDSQKLNGPIIDHFLALLKKQNAPSGLIDYFSDLLDWHRIRDKIRNLTESTEPELHRILFDVLGKRLVRGDKEGLVEFANRRKAEPEYQSIFRPYREKLNALEDLQRDITSRFAAEGSPGYATSMYDLLHIVEHAGDYAKLKSPNLTRLANEIAAEWRTANRETGLRQSVPSESIRERGTPELAAVGQDVIKRLSDAGLSVNVIQTKAGELLNGLTQSMGSYDRARKAINWVLSDLSAPSSEDIRVLFEEAGHALFDKEGPAVTDPILRAIASLGDRSTFELDQIRRDIANAYPEGVRPDVMNEELLMGIVSRKLANEGFNPAASRSIAQSIVRMLKDIYLRSAMWLQQTMLGREYSNPDLALRYYQNRLESFLAGNQSLGSWIDRIGASKPQFDTELSWHQPVSVEKDLSETYNPVSGQIDVTPLIEDSVEAAVMNGRIDDMRFSVPAGASIDQYVDPSVKLNREAAVNNEISETRRLAGELSGIDAEKFRKINGLTSTENIAAVHAATAQRRNARNFNPTQRLSQFVNEQNIIPSHVDAIRRLTGEMGKIGKIKTKDETVLEKQNEFLDTALVQADRELDNYRDAQFMGDTIQRGFKSLMREDIKREIQTSRALGTIFQIAKQLGERAGEPLDPAVVGALRRLYTGDQLNGQNLFDLLDFMARDPSIDFTRPATEIRDQIRQTAAMVPDLDSYQRMAQNTPDGRALLSTVIAFGKLHQRTMAELEMRRMQSGEERAALEQKLRDTWKETSEQITTGIRRVARSAKLEERARGRYREILGRVLTARKHKEHLEQRIAINEKAIPVYKTILDRLDPKIKRAADFEFADGMLVRLPKTLDSNPEWEDQRINLNITKGPITDMQPIAEKLAAWTRLRENAAKAGDQAALNYDYQTARQQLNTIFNNRFFKAALSNTDQLTTGLVLSPVPVKLASIGVPSADSAGRLVTKFVSDVQAMRNQADILFGYRNPRLEQKLIGTLSDGAWWKAKKVSMQWFDTYIKNAAFGFMEKQQFSEGGNREAELNQAYAKLGNWLLGQEHIKPLIQDRMDRFMPALRDYIESEYESGQYWNKQNTEAGLLVKEPKLGGALRAQAQVGMRTFQRKFSPAFSNMVHALRLSGWEFARDDFKKAAELYQAGPQAVGAMLSKYIGHETYGDTVRNDFLYKLFHVPDESAFESPPIDQAGTTHTVDPMIATRAWDEAGSDLLQAIKLMFAYQNGEGPVGEYVQSILLNLADQFQAASSALKKVEPDSTVQVKSLVGLIPDALIDARQFPHWPGEWFDYHKFDRNDNSRMAERISGQINFGRDTRTLANLVDTAQSESNVLLSTFESAKRTAERTVPSGRRKDIEAGMEKILSTDKTPALQVFKTGKERLQYLQKLKEREPFIQSFVTELSDYYRRGSDQVGSLKFGIRFAQFLSGLLVNNPSSAISQLATMFDIPAQWGASPTMLKASSTAIKFTAKDIAGGLAQGVGWAMKQSAEEADFVRLKLNDPEVARRFGDITATLEGENDHPWVRRARIAREIQSATVNRLGERAGFTPTRPFAPFFQTVFNANRGLTIAMWKLAKGYVSKGIDFLDAHPGKESLTAEDLGLKGLEKDSFEKWRKDVELYGLRFDEMVRGAKDRMTAGDKTALTDQELSKLYSLGLNRVSLEPNIATMPLFAFNNSLVKFVLPLLGWSYRRALQVAEKAGGLSPHDKRALKYVGTGMLGLAATGLGGLALSLAVDAYQEDVVGKKRNIRSLRVPTTGQDWVAIQERLNRIGTFGLWGELINGAVNVGTGQGDNRMLSVDQRVVALQAFQGIQGSISAFINQDFDPDYQHVVRPFISSLGAGGLLQYLQVANHAFGLDNAEARTVKRINAENYLRVVGRDLGLSIRGGGGGYNTPTAITPWISRMEYAAYANSPDEFRQAYRGALQEAKEAGKPDPADYVKKAFETRHPIRYVFAQTPSENDYRQILANLDERGNEDVTEAVRLFNYYGAHLGLTPFSGSQKKNAQRYSGLSSASRARSMAFAY